MNPKPIETNVTRCVLKVRFLQLKTYVSKKNAEHRLMNNLPIKNNKVDLSLTHPPRTKG